MDSRTGLLTLGAMARKLGVTTKWLKSEAESGNLPHLRAGERYLFEPATVISILVKRAKINNVNGAKKCTV